MMASAAVTIHFGFSSTIFEDDDILLSFVGGDRKSVKFGISEVYS